MLFRSCPSLNIVGPSSGANAGTNQVRNHYAANGTLFVAPGGSSPPWADRLRIESIVNPSRKFAVFEYNMANQDGMTVTYGNTANVNVAVPTSNDVDAWYNSGISTELRYRHNSNNCVVVFFDSHAEQVQKYTILQGRFQRLAR